MLSVETESGLSWDENNKIPWEDQPVLSLNFSVYASSGWVGLYLTFYVLFIFRALLNTAYFGISV